MTVTRTQNPLPFNDLEPRRFEDLVRQLFYHDRDRKWLSLEATGRAGSDRGMDFRGVERAAVSTDGSQDTSFRLEDRLWIGQCKREDGIGPSRIKEIVKEALQTSLPYGLLVAANCDFSVKTRQTFRSELDSHGVKEGILWGKAELEDRLLAPRYEHLLFVYFGISLKPRAVARTTILQKLHKTKNQLVSALGGFEEYDTHRVLLLHDAHDDKYPHVKDVPDFATRFRWSTYYFRGHPVPGHIGVLWRYYYAYFDEQTEEWDASTIRGWDRPNPPVGAEHLQSEPLTPPAVYSHFGRGKQEMLALIGLIPYDRIVLVDAHGDSWHPFPHIRIELDSGSPFSRIIGWFEHSNGYYVGATTSEKNRINVFPEDVRLNLEALD